MTGEWQVRIKGGPAFAVNAAGACRGIAVELTEGPRREALLRLADALDEAIYNADDEDDSGRLA